MNYPCLCWKPIKFLFFSLVKCLDYHYIFKCLLSVYKLLWLLWPMKAMKSGIKDDTFQINLIIIFCIFFWFKKSSPLHSGADASTHFGRVLACSRCRRLKINVEDLPLKSNPYNGSEFIPKIEPSIQRMITAFAVMLNSLNPS